MSGPGNRAVRALARHFRCRAEWYLVPLLFFGAVVILYSPVFGGRLGFGWDTIESYWPDLVYFSRELSGGEWPLWNPYDRGGYPIYADPQAALLYPLQWLFAGISVAVGDSPWWLSQGKMLLHHALAGAMMHLFLRKRGLSAPAAALGGLVWICATPWLMHKASNVLLPMAWTPLVWLAIDALIEKPSWRRGAALAAALYLPGSAGSPPGFFYVVLMALFYGGFRIVGQSISLPRESGATASPLVPYLKRIAIGVAVAGAITVAMQLVIVLPGLELAEHTLRDNRGLSYALSFPLPVDRTLLGFASPAVGKVDFFLGGAGLMLIIAALVLTPRRDRFAPVFLLASASFFTALAFGKATPLLGWLVEHVPGFGLFRAANRYKLIAVIMLAALAGYGAQALIDISRDRWRRLVPALALPLAIVVGAVVFATTTSKVARPESTAIVVIALAVAVAIAAAMRGPRAARFAIVGLVPLLIYEPSHYHFPRGKILEAQPDHLADRAKIADLVGAGTDVRIFDEFWLEQRPGSRLGVRDFRGYPSGDPLDLRRYREVLAKATGTPQLLTAFNVGYVLHGPHHRKGRRSNRLKKPPAPPAFERVRGRIYRALDPAPRVACYGRVEVAQRATLLSKLAERREGIAFVEPNAVLGDATEQLVAATPTEVPGRITTFEADRVVADVDCDGPSLVVLNEVDYAGWRVRVDGADAEPVRANYLLRAVVVDGGAHTIEWRFEPRGYRWLLLLWWLGVLAILAALAWPVLARRLPRARRG